jgi:N-acetylmuramoyl-L-alanine amidase
MTDYHAFRAIAPSTPAAIIETGFLNLDRSLLVDHPDVVAEGVVAGVLCFVRSESVEPISTP